MYGGNSLGIIPAEFYQTWSNFYGAINYQNKKSCFLWLTVYMSICACIDAFPVGRGGGGRGGRTALEQTVAADAPISHQGSCAPWRRRVPGPDRKRYAQARRLEVLHAPRPQEVSGGQHRAVGTIRRDPDLEGRGIYGDLLIPAMVWTVDRWFCTGCGQGNRKIDAYKLTQSVRRASVKCTSHVLIDEDSNGIQWAVLISDCAGHADVGEDSILLYKVFGYRVWIVSLKTLYKGMQTVTCITERDCSTETNVQCHCAYCLVAAVLCPCTPNACDNIQFQTVENYLRPCSVSQNIFFSHYYWLHS